MRGYIQLPNFELLLFAELSYYKHPDHGLRLLPRNVSMDSKSDCQEKCSDGAARGAQMPLQYPHKQDAGNYRDGTAPRKVKGIPSAPQPVATASLLGLMDKYHTFIRSDRFG